MFCEAIEGRKNVERSFPGKARSYVQKDELDPHAVITVSDVLDPNADDVAKRPLVGPDVAKTDTHVETLAYGNPENILCVNRGWRFMLGIRHGPRLVAAQRGCDSLPNLQQSA